MFLKQIIVHRSKLVFLISGCLLLYLLLGRLTLGLNRYFDVDEYAHLHYAYNYSQGLSPYTDFFYIFPPFFLIILSPLWVLFSNPITVLIEARILIFIFFLLLLIMVYFLSRLTHSRGVSLWGVILLAFLPIPYDKLLEVRPDLPAVFFSFLGMYLLLRGVGREGKKKGFNFFLLLSGICYGIGVGIVPKTLFFLPSVFLTFVFLWWVSRFSQKILKELVVWLAGLSIPLFVILVMIVATGEPYHAFLLMTKVPSQASKLLSEIYNHSFYMFPSLFFHPNQTYYGMGGIYNPQYIINLSIWIIASIWVILRVVGFYAEEGITRQTRVLLIGSTFLFNYLGFTQFFPMKHAQYLIPLVPFVAYYMADFLLTVVCKVQIYIKRGWVNIVFVLLFSSLIVWATEAMNRPKSWWSNTKDLENIKSIVTTIPPNTYLFDLTGMSLVYKDPYYICCLPYGQYLGILGKLPSLPESLQKTKTKYVFNLRFDTLPPEDRQYILETYPVKMLGDLMMTTK